MKTRKDVKVAVDLDGVVWDLLHPWIAAYNKHFDDNLLYEDVTSYELDNFMKKATREEFCALLQTEEVINNIKLFENSYEYLKKLNERFTVFIATKTHYKNFSHKVERLLELCPFIDYNQIICIQDKRLLNVDWLIDDCVDNLRAPSKFIPMILDAPYNRDCPWKWRRAKDLKEVYEKLMYEHGVSE